MDKNLEKIKVIFLDIDGVLNVIPQGRDIYGGIFHQHFMDNLKRIVDATNAKIVISSSWRTSGVKYMQEMWAFRNIGGEVIDCTPSIDMGKVYFWNNKRTSIDVVYDSLPRGVEIEYWIDNESQKFGDLQSYVILDDDSDMLLKQKNNYVQTYRNNEHPDCIDDGFGLTDICTDAAIWILNNVNYVKYPF